MNKTQVMYDTIGRAVECPHTTPNGVAWRVPILFNNSRGEPYYYLIFCPDCGSRLRGGSRLRVKHE